MKLAVISNNSVVLGGLKKLLEESRFYDDRGSINCFNYEQASENYSIIKISDLIIIHFDFYSQIPFFFLDMSDSVIFYVDKKKPVIEQLLNKLKVGFFYADDLDFIRLGSREYDDQQEVFSNMSAKKKRSFFSTWEEERKIWKFPLC